MKNFFIKTLSDQIIFEKNYFLEILIRNPKIPAIDPKNLLKPPPKSKKKKKKKKDEQKTKKVETRSKKEVMKFNLKYLSANIFVD